MASNKKHGLTEKRKKFCDVLIADINQNATSAYKQAYPTIKNDNAAAACASKLLRNSNVQAYLETFRKKDTEKAEYGREFVLEKLALMAEIGLSVNEKKDDDGNIISKKFNDSYTGSKGIELLGRHHKLFTDKIEHTGEVKLTGVLKIDSGPVSLEDWVKGVGGAQTEEKT